MSGIERIPNLNRQGQHALNFKWFACNAVLEGRPVQRLHHDEGVAFVLPDVVNRADVGMIERRGSPRFTSESFQGLLVSGKVVRQELQCNETS
jgi:hypothetical protein